MNFTSPNIAPCGWIPCNFTCSGGNMIPAFQWQCNPHAAYYAIIVDDPDAIPVVGKIFVHMNLFNIPSHVTSLSLNENYFSIPGVQALQNDSESYGWFGPCPPEGDPPHKYRFSLFALKAEIILSPNDINFNLENFVDRYAHLIVNNSTWEAFYQR